MSSKPEEPTPTKERRQINWMVVGIIVFAIAVAIEGAWTDSIDKSDSVPAPTATTTVTPAPSPLSP